MGLSVKKIVPVLLTLVVVAAALLVLRHLWRYYMYDPWTRDAHIGADVIQVAPDVSGQVAEVKVRDNAFVHRGEVLFVIDQARYRLALQQAQAELEQSRAALAQEQAALLQSQAGERQLRREAARDGALKDLLAAEDIEARRANLEKAQAGVAASRAAIMADEARIATVKAAVAQAQLNLDRTVVRSPVDGRVNDRTVRLGDYVTTGKPVLAVLDTASFRVDGYFEETRLHGIHPGQAVEIHVMGEAGVLRGHVQSIAAGIEDRYRSDGANLLPNVTPAFDWVRLAQRVPVRIVLDDVPEQIHLVAGRTVTVSVIGAEHAGRTDDAGAARS